MKTIWTAVKRKSAVLLSLCGVLAVCLLAAAGVQQKAAVSASAEITNWGLSFQQEGEPPIGNADSAALAQYNALYRAETQEKILYLTFDAGYENGHTPAILDALKKHGAPAAFFLVGNYLETQPDLVRRMVEEGHTVGNHTYSHPDMSAITTEEDFCRELEKNEALYHEITGQEMTKLYRPPQGKFWPVQPGNGPALGLPHGVFGAWPMWTGMRTTSPPGRRPLKSCCLGFIRERWCCFTARPPPTPPSLTSCSPVGRTWATPLASWKKSRLIPNSK